MVERVWFDIEQIPSGGIAYPKGWKVSISPYSFGDILNLARAAETGIAALDKIVSGIKCNFDKDLLLPADIIYLGIYRKLVSTKHSKIEFKTECPVCMKENHKVMDLKELKFKELKIPALPIIVELDQGTIEFNPITIKQYKEVFRKFDGDPSWLFAYGAVNMTPGEARDIIQAAVDEDKETLDEVANLLDFGLEPIEFECEDEYCDNMIKVSIDSPDTLVFPFREARTDNSRRIKFGHESSSKRKGNSGS